MWLILRDLLNILYLTAELHAHQHPPHVHDHHMFFIICLVSGPPNLPGRKVQHKKPVSPFLFFPFFLLDQKKVLSQKARIDISVQNLVYLSKTQNIRIRNRLTSDSYSESLCLLVVQTVPLGFWCSTKYLRRVCVCWYSEPQLWNLVRE